MNPEEELKELEDLVREYFMALQEKDEAFANGNNSGINYLYIVDLQDKEDRLKRKVRL